MGDFVDFKPGAIVPDAPAAASPLTPTAQTPASITRDDVVRIAKEEGVDPARALAHWQQESSGGKNPRDSVDGAKGGFQVMPGTFKAMLPNGDQSNPHDNARAGIRYMRKAQDAFPDNPEAQAASYFTGLDRVRKYNGDVSKMAEIRDGGGVSVPDYVKGVMGHYNRFKQQLPGGATTASSQKNGGEWSDFQPDQPEQAAPAADVRHPGILSDTANLLGQGAAQTVQGLSYAANKATGGWLDSFTQDHLGRSLTDIAGDVSNRYFSQMSPEMQAAAQKEWVSSKESETFGNAWSDPRAYYNAVVNSLPATVATMGPAGGAASFAARTAMKASIAKSIAMKLPVEAAKEAAQKAAERAATYAALASGSVGEGIIAGGQQGVQVEDSIAKLSGKELEAAPAYQKYLEQFGGDKAKAREAVSNDAGTQTLWQVGLATALLGAGFDGYVGNRIGKLMAGTAEQKSLGKSILHSVAIEVPTELTQGFFEQYLGNIAEWEHANPGKNLWEGVWNNVVGSGVGALGMGTGFGAMTAGGTESAKPSTLPPTKKDVDKARDLTDTDPTEAEKKNGKYQKGVVDWHGEQIAFENPKGSTRSGKDKDGKDWSIKMAHDYGEFPQYEGSDGDAVDVIVGPHLKSGKAFVIDQQDTATGKHDEYKTLVGFDNVADARRGYLSMYEKGWKGLKSIRQLSVEQFKAELKAGKLNKSAQEPQESENPAPPQEEVPAPAAAAPVTTSEGEPNAAPIGEQQQGGEQQHTGVGAQLPGEGVDRNEPTGEPGGGAEASGGDSAVEGGPQQQEPAAPAPEPVAEEPAASTPERDSRLEQIAQIYDAIKAGNRAQGVRNRIGKAPTEGEDLDLLHQIALAEKARYEKRHGPVVIGGEPAGGKGSAEGSAEKPPAEPQAPEAPKEPVAEQPAEPAAPEAPAEPAPEQPAPEAPAPEQPAPPPEESTVGPSTPKEPRKPREPKKPKEAGDTGPRVKAPEDPVVVMIRDADNKRLTDHIYGAAQLTPVFEDGVTILEEGVIQMHVLNANLTAVEDAMKKMGFKFTDRLQADANAARIQLSAVYKPKKSDIQDTGIVGGKPAGQKEGELPEPTSDLEKDVDNLIAATKASSHFTIERPNATFGTMLFLEAVREQFKTFLQFAGPGFGGQQGNTRGYGKSLKEAILDKAKTPEGMKAVRAQAERYIGVMKKFEELTIGAKNVQEAHDAIKGAMHEGSDANSQYTPLGSEIVRVTGISYRDIGQFVSLFQPNEESIDQTNRVVKKEPDRPPYIENTTRVGRPDFRKGKNISETEFKEAFGFREVEFGEWVNQDTRQGNVNLAYDSLMDLSQELGFPPKVIGLGGTLALSFGSRGQKNTKAAAHFEMSMEGGAVINLTKTNGNGTVSHEWFHALEHYLRRKDGGGDYTEGLRSAMEQHYDIARLESRVRTILQGEEIYGAGRNTPPKERALQWLQPKRSGQGWQSGYEGILSSPSKYKTDSRAMDGQKEAYYQTPVEMVARANEAYLFDRLKGGSPYLTGPMVREGAMTKATGYKGTSYPTGEERVRFANDYKSFYDGLEFKDDGTIEIKAGARTPLQRQFDEAKVKADEIAGRIDEIMDEMGLRQFPEVKNDSMVESMFYHLKNGWFPENAKALMEWVGQAHRVELEEVRGNLILQKKGQEDFEAALGQFAAQRIIDWRIEGRGPKGIFDGLVDLYRKQPKLNIRTSTSSSLQQFSTPLPIAYLAGLLGRVEAKSTVYEPTAGNGLLAITATPKNVIANELEAHRAKNLKLLGFPRVTTIDAVKARDEKVYKNNEADVVLANPPFGKLENQALVDGYAVHKIDHLIVGRSLPAMFDKGRAVLIIGAQKETGEINSREVPFFNWLYSHFNVASHFEVDGDFYERQGAAWPIRVITIAGRRLDKSQATPQSGTIRRVSYQAGNAQEAYDELWNEYERAAAASQEVVTGHVGAQPAPESGGGARGAGEPAVPAGNQGETGSTTGGGGRGRSAPNGGRVPGEPGAGPGAPSVPRGAGGRDSGESTGEHTGDVGRPGDNGASAAGAVEGRAGGEQGSQPGDVPVAGTGLEGLSPEDVDRIFLDEPVLVSDPRTGAPESSSGGTGDKTPPRGPRGGGGKPKQKSDKSGVSPTERALGLDLSNEFAEINKIIGDEGSGGSMFSRKLYEEALGTVDATIYQQLRGAFEKVWNAVRAKVQDATRGLIHFRQIVSERFGKAVDKINAYMRAFVLDKMYPAEQTLPKSAESKDNLHQVVYNGKSQGENMGILVPRWLAPPLERALDALEDQISDQHGSIDEFVQKELGYGSIPEMFKALSGYQIDNIALSINQIKKGKGMVIGDATGVGKGRQAAAIIWWAIKNGKVPVFMSFKDDLYSDMFRDLLAIGHGEIAPLITNTDGYIIDPRDEKGNKKLFSNKPAVIRAQVKEIAETGKLPKDRHALFTTYAQINTANDRRAALTKLLQSGNAVMIMDESHNASGESGVGEFLMNLFQETEPPVVYLSATYAKRTDNMPIYMRTNIGSLASDPQSLVDLLSKGGPQMQSVIAQMLVEDGQMSRREKDMSMLSVKYETDDDNVVRDTRLMDEATEALRSIVRADRAFFEWFKENQRKLVELLPPGAQITWGKGNRSHTTTALQHGLFTSIVHNFVKQLLLSVAADNAVHKIIDSLNRNEKPVVPLENTMEAALDYFIETNNVKLGDSLDGYGWKTVLTKALDRRRTFTYKDPTGTHTGRYDVPLAMLPPHVTRTFSEASEVIGKFQTPLSASPIDYMRSELAKYGWEYTGKDDANGLPERKYSLLSAAKGKRLTPLRVAEITGRKHTIDYSGAVPVLSSRTKEQGESIKTVKDFNAGNLDAVFLNSSGSTGISLHSSETFRDQRKRFMLVLQAAADISVFQQTLGRVHRTGQTVPPDYMVLATALPSQKRPMAVLKKKMKSLLSNTSAGQESATDVAAIDFINMYGDEAVSEYLRENQEVSDFVGEEIPEQGAVENIALKASGRIALLSVADQKDFYEKVEHAYDSIITMKNESGTNKLVVRTLETKAIPQQEQTLTDGGSADSVFGGPSYLVQYSIQVQGERPSADDVRKAVTDALAGRTPEQILQAIEEERKAPFEQARVSELNKIEGSGGLMEQLKKEDLSPAKRKDLEAQVIAIKKKLQTFDGVRQETLMQLQHMKIGHGTRLNLENGELPFGVIVGIKSNLPASGNPWSPSNFTINFMINNENRRASLPLSKIKRDNMIDSRPRTVAPESLDHHFRKEQTVGGARPRETRYFVVGNIPAGFEATNMSGDIVTFTMDDDTVRTGLFLPRNFNPGSVVDQNLFLSNVNRYGEEFANGIYDYLTSYPTQRNYQTANDLLSIGVASKDNVIRLTGNRQGSEIEMVILRSNGGKKIAESKALTEIVGELAAGPKQPWRATIRDKETALKAIRFLAKRRGLYVLGSQVSGSQPFMAKYQKVQEQSAQFRRGEPGAKVSGSDAYKLASAVTEISKSWTDMPDVLVVQSVNQLPADIRAQVEREGAQDVGGVYKDGKVYLVADNIADEEDARVTLVHEVKGHYGLRKTFGKGLVAVLDQIAVARAPQVKALLQAQGMANTSENRQRAAEEILAVMAQGEPKLGFVRRAIAAIAQWLREHGILSKNKLTDAEIISKFILPAASTIENGTSVGEAPAEQSDSQTHAVYRRTAELFNDMLASDSRVGLWSRTVGTMFNLAQKNAAFRRVFDAGQDFLSDIWRNATASEKVAPSWFKRGWLQGINRKDADLVSQWLLRGTLINRVFADSELRAGQRVDSPEGAYDLKGLTDDQIKMYHQAHSAIKVALERQAKAFIAKGATSMGVSINKDLELEDFAADITEQLERRIAEAKDNIEILRDAKPEGYQEQMATMEAALRGDQQSVGYIKQLLEHVNKLISEGYFPLSRYGTHYVAVYSTEENYNKGNATYFALHDGLNKTVANVKSNLDARRVRKLFPNAHKIETGIISKDAFKLYDGLNLDALEVFAKHLGIDQDETFQEAYKQLFSSRSVMKHLIHRKGTPGFSKDGYRALADFIMTTSRATSATENLPRMMRAISDIKDGDVKDQAIGLYDYLKNPVEEAHKLRGYLFFHFIGGSLSSAMVNLTQTGLVTAPYLTKFTNPARVSAELAAAAKDAVKDPFAKNAMGEYVYQGGLWDDLRRAEEDGTTASQEIFQMMGVASGSKMAGNKYAESFLKAWGSMFGYAETFNRRVAYIAAHRLAEESDKLGNAHEFAENAVYETQFIYNKGNRPVWARGALGSTIFTFKQFNINVLELMQRMPLQQKIYMLFLLMLAAGVEGLPFAEDLEDVIDTIGQRFPELGVTTNSKKWLDKTARKILGQYMGNALVQGLPSAVTPFDVSQRLSMGNIIPGTAMAKVSETDKFRDVRDLIGPAAGLLYGAAGGAEELLRGNVSGAAKRALPIAVQNVLKGSEMLAEGKARDNRHQFVADVSSVEAAGKMIGLNPNAVAERQRVQQNIKTDQQFVNQMRTSLMDDYINALIHHQQDDLNEITRKISAWNRDNPTMPIVLNPRSIRERLRAAELSPDVRLVKNAPKALRAGIAAQLRGED